jgi:tRNA-dihydrouridine synthase B
VMIARGALANPWIFRQTRDLLAGRPLSSPTLDERRRVILDHHERMATAMKPHVALGRIRKFAGFYLNGLERGSDLRRRLSEPQDGEAFRALVESFFDGLARESQAA